MDLSTKLHTQALLLLLFFKAPALWALTGQSALPAPSAGPAFYKTSFDCTKAKDYSVEQAICKNEELAKLDLEMSEAYRKRLTSATTPPKTELVQSQKSWLTIRNSYNVNPFHGDPSGTLSDLSDFYRDRIVALRSDQSALLKTELPQEYDWLRAIAPPGFSEGFSISRGYMGCEDPCKTRPALYRLLSIWGSGIGDPPGDVDTPFKQLVSKLASEGWIKCRSADDSGKPTMDYFTKKDKMLAISRYYSMGAGNSIGLLITISDPLPQKPKPMPANPPVTITADWISYSSPDVGLEVRYPPGWRMTDISVPNSHTKYLGFSAKGYPGDFTITMELEEMFNHQPIFNNDEEAERTCLPSLYHFAGLPSRGCLRESEVVGEGTCSRYLESVEVETGGRHWSFGPSRWGSFADDSGQYKLTDLYEKILGTIKLRQPVAPVNTMQ